MTTLNSSTDLEQRAGRIVRRGNENEKVKIFRYITENTFDSYLFQILENKQKFISQIMTSKTPVRAMEDIDDTTLSYAEIKALATANPHIKEKMDLETEITKLKMLESNFNSNKFSLEDKILKVYPNKIKNLEERKENILKDIELFEEVKKAYNDFKDEKTEKSLIQNFGQIDQKEKIKSSNKDENFENFEYFKLNGETFKNKKEAGEKLLEVLKTIRVNEKKEIGEYKGFKIISQYDFRLKTYTFNLKGNSSYSGYFGTSTEGNFTRMDNTINKIKDELEHIETEIKTTKENIEIAKIEVLKPFPKEEELKEKTLRLAEVDRLLNLREENEITLEENENLIKEIENEVMEILTKDLDYDTAKEEIDRMNKNKVYEIYTNEEDLTIKYLFDVEECKLTVLDDDTNKVLYECIYTKDIEDLSNSSPLEQMKNDIKNIDLVTEEVTQNINRIEVIEREEKQEDIESINLSVPIVKMV